MTATLERAATLTMNRPALTAGNFLDLWVKAYTPPRQGAVEAVVSLGAPGREPVEVGRFAVFPSAAFTAAEAREQRAYRFDAADALRQLKPGDTAVTVRVELAPIEGLGQAAGAQLTLSKAVFSPRP